MRPIWSGSVSFGLVNIPVKLYLAAKSQHFSFRMLHKKDQATVEYKRFCSAEEKEIPWDEIGKGYEYQKGEYLLIEEEDFNRIERPAARVVDIQQFVDRPQLSAMFFDTPYYLEPSKGAEKAYALLREALKRSGKVGIGRVALKEREYVAAVMAEGDALVVSTLRYAADIRAPGELAIPGKVEVPEKQVDLALMLVEQLSGDFDAESYKDDYEERVGKMIQEKLAGLPAPKKAPARAPPAQVVDLAEVLARSIHQAKKPGKAASSGEEAGERRAPRQMAARASGSKRRRR